MMHDKNSMMLLFYLLFDVLLYNQEYKLRDIITEYCVLWVVKYLLLILGIYHADATTRAEVEDFGFSPFGKKI